MMNDGGSSLPCTSLAENVSSHKSLSDVSFDLGITNTTKGSQVFEKLKVAQDNIEFLKQEHASMLSGLHEEIQHLQDLCRDLQFRCEVGGRIVPESEFFQCSKDELEEKVDNILKENTELKRKLSESHQAIDILDQKEKLALWQHHQELEQRDTATLRLEKELDAKCNLISQLTSQGSRRKKSGFWRRFNFSASNSLATSAGTSQPDPLFPAESHHERLTKEDLPTEIQHSLPSYESQYQSYSSYSSLSDKSVSDDEGLGHQSFAGKDVKEDKFTVKLPPISNLPMVSKRQLIRHQLRIRSLATKVTSDSLAIDQMPSPELTVKRLSKA